MTLAEMPTNPTTNPATNLKTGTSTQDQDALRPIDLALADFLKRQYSEASDAQCRLAAVVSHQLGAGHLCLPLDDPNRQAEALRVCGQPLAKLLEHNPLVSSDGSTPLVLDYSRLYLRRYWYLESDIATHLHARLQETLLDASSLQAPLARLFDDSTETPDWQKIACLLAGRKRIGIITGGPGTGKTTTVVKLLALLQQHAMGQGRLLTFRLAAPTGKAAARLSESILDKLDGLDISESLRQSIPTQASTLHRLLGIQHGSRHFRHNHQSPLAADLVVVDEASMIDIDMMQALLDALPAQCRLILVGDKDQLASVEAGAVMADLCQEADNPAYDADTMAFIAEAGGSTLKPCSPVRSGLSQQTVKLQINWRAKDAPGITALADAINRQDNKDCTTAWQTYPQQLQRVRHQESWIQHQLIEGETGYAALLDAMHASRPTTNTADAWAKDLLKQLGQQQLLTPLRHGPDGIEGLNRRIIDRLHARHLVERPQMFPGLPLLVTTNLYDLNLMNGDMGLLLEHPELGLRAAFAVGGSVRWIIPEQLETRSQTAFALSVHQAQGSEFKRVLLHLPEEALPIITKELLYTAVTRAQAQFVLIEANTQVFTNAISRRAERVSGLAERLQGA